MHIGSPLLYLAAFALCAAPVIIYLVFRRKRKDVAWGAMYILRRLLESRSRTTAWKQYAIVALRALALAALAFAFLHPFTPWRAPGGGAFPKAPRGMHRFILLDVSNSMDAACGSGSCFDAAISLCRKMLVAATAPGRIDILPLDGRDEPCTFASPPIRQDNIESFIARLSRGHGPADLEKGLQRAVIALRATPHERKELYVLSDLSAADLDPPERFAGLFRTLRAMGVKTYALRYANPDACNFALHELSPQMDVLLAGQPTIFYVALGYYQADAPATAVNGKAETWLAIRDENGNTLFEDTLALAPGRKTLQVPLALPAGDHVLTASLKTITSPTTCSPAASTWRAACASSCCRTSTSATASPTRASG
ncbi:MAG TPA: vWA domain-containing protein [Planctomycetota bacterium]|nr:vWA domain-containing protein [Planctomycetota bacterium]